MSNVSCAYYHIVVFPSFFFFFFNDTATTEIYTLSLHDALPIYDGRSSGAARPLHHRRRHGPVRGGSARHAAGRLRTQDRKSTRLNSSHSQISYAVFCLKKKKQQSNTFTHC